MVGFKRGVFSGLPNNKYYKASVKSFLKEKVKSSISFAHSMLVIANFMIVIHCVINQRNKI